MKGSACGVETAPPSRRSRARCQLGQYLGASFDFRGIQSISGVPSIAFRALEAAGVTLEATACLFVAPLGVAALITRTKRRSPFELSGYRYTASHGNQSMPHTRRQSQCPACNGFRNECKQDDLAPTLLRIDLYAPL